MTKIDIIQNIINKTQARTYLEIGVHKGHTFLRIRAKQKIAVDPYYLISARKKFSWAFKNPCNFLAKYYRLSSDEFFARKKFHKSFDIVFVDGLHTFQQSLKDVYHSLSCLNHNGVIVMDDCNPPNEAAAQPAHSLDQAASLNLPGWTGEWCGDVWKTICHLRSVEKNLNVFVLDCDHGIGIITRGKPDALLNFTEEEVNQLTYQDLANRRNELLNLKDANYFHRF
jgi:hypothetical protein